MPPLHLVVTSLHCILTVNDPRVHTNNDHAIEDAKGPFLGFSSTAMWVHIWSKVSTPPLLGFKIQSFQVFSGSYAWLYVHGWQEQDNLLFWSLIREEGHMIFFTFHHLRDLAFVRFYCPHKGHATVLCSIYITLNKCKCLERLVF